jgi:hypothetical protein
LRFGGLEKFYSKVYIVPKQSMPKSYNRQILIERFILLGAVLSAVSALGIGAYFAYHFCDPHWMNRSGAAVVVIQVVGGMAEFSRRRRLEQLRLSAGTGGPRHSKIAQKRIGTHIEKIHTFIDEEIGKSEFHAVAIVLCLAAVGEFFHGFGDLVFELFTR